VLRDGADATILAYGAACRPALDASTTLAELGIETAVINARFAKPVDREMVRQALSTRRPVITVEDHSLTGGFGAAILEVAADLGLPADQVTRLAIPPDRFIAHGSRAGQKAECGIDASGIAATVRECLGAGSAAADRMTREATAALALLRPVQP
jgi:1-deoxy-D-xylulose-5-phosphate synthase